ncbi:SCP2 sterol-binding domain-containing protein [Micromonospora chersina]|uniref:SCP2 sterol-binding domain-containing protein n=1 Tax=Micromonospora chersina TaxID=47854 RepID=UPI0037AC9A4C
MGNPTCEFFSGLPHRAHAVLPPTANGTIRFDLTCENGGVGHWHVVISRGETRVSRENRNAELVITTDESLFDDLVVGAKRLGPHLRQGRLGVKGSGVSGVRLFNYVMRLLPAVKGARDPRIFAVEERGREK